MGLLDDAIREHLELKRRLGADPAEVTKLEREAFGAADAAAAPAAAEADPAPAPPPIAVEPDPTPEPVAAEPDPAPEPEPAPVAVEQPTRQFTLEELEDAEEASPAPAAEPAPAEPVAPAADATDAGEHDELEETPDFLQETPEHERLWFEQKPPKDFDF